MFTGPAPPESACCRCRVRCNNKNFQGLSVLPGQFKDILKIQTGCVLVLQRAPGLCKAPGDALIVIETI